MTTEYKPIRSWEFSENDDENGNNSGDVLRVRECGTHVELSTDNWIFPLTEEQWKALCTLQYTLRWMTEDEKKEVPF